VTKLFIDFWSCFFILENTFHVAIKRMTEEEQRIKETWKRRRVLDISTSVPFENQKGNGYLLTS